MGMKKKLFIPLACRKKVTSTRFSRTIEYVRGTLSRIAHSRNCDAQTALEAARAIMALDRAVENALEDSASPTAPQGGKGEA